MRPCKKPSVTSVVHCCKCASTLFLPIRTRLYSWSRPSKLLPRNQRPPASEVKIVGRATLAFSQDYSWFQVSLRSPFTPRCCDFACFLKLRWIRWLAMLWQTFFQAAEIEIPRRCSGCWKSGMIKDNRSSARIIGWLIREAWVNLIFLFAGHLHPLPFPESIGGGNWLLGIFPRERIAWWNITRHHFYLSLLLGWSWVTQHSRE